jgi:hypothetical protein
MRNQTKMAWTAGLLALALWAPAARAGRYHVYSCRTPSGEAAPVDGWVGSKTGSFTYTRDTCGEPGGALLAALGDQPTRTANSDIATWGLAVPLSVSLAAATMWRAGDADGGANLDAIYGIWLAAPDDRNDPSDAFGQCTAGLSCPSGVGVIGQPFAVQNLVVVPASKLSSHLYVNASCFGESEYECPAGQGDPNNYAAAVYLYAADLTLEQIVGPSASNVGGDLASAPALLGTSDVTFTATDPGSGVFEAVFTIDGKVVQSTLLDQAGGRCRNVGQSADGLPAFLYLQPCPTSVSAVVGFDTSMVANGPHHLLVSVIDAAGNAAPVLDRTVTVANPGAPGPPNGRNASSEARLTARWRSTPRTRLTTGYDGRETIVGRLTGPGGTPIAGALLEASARPDLAGATAAPPRVLTTGSDGRFTLSLPAHLSSRTLRISYAARIGELRPAATRTLALAVRAPVSLTISPRTTSVGGWIRFRGRLAGGPVPRGGKPLILEARSGSGAWIEFDVMRTDSRGRYRSGYRFKFPGPATYQFRVVCQQEADYPYASGTSRTISVHER